MENDLKSSKTLSTLWFLVDLCLAVFLSGFSFIQPGQTSVVALVQTPSLMMTMNTMMLMMVNKKLEMVMIKPSVLASQAGQSQTEQSSGWFALSGMFTIFLGLQKRLEVLTVPIL